MIRFQLAGHAGHYDREEFVIAGPGGNARQLQTVLQTELDFQRRASEHAHLGAQGLALAILTQWGATITQPPAPWVRHRVY